MLQISLLAPLGAVMKALDTPKMLDEIGKLDGQKIVKQDPDEIGKVVLVVAKHMLPKIGDITQPLAELVAAVRHISVDEAMKVDLIDFLKELFSDSGIMGFFKSAARRGLST